MIKKSLLFTLVLATSPFGLHASLSTKTLKTAGNLISKVPTHQVQPANITKSIQKNLTNVVTAPMKTPQQSLITNSLNATRSLIGVLTTHKKDVFIGASLLAGAWGILKHQKELRSTYQNLDQKDLTEFSVILATSGIAAYLTKKDNETFMQSLLFAMGTLSTELAALLIARSNAISKIFQSLENRLEPIDDIEDKEEDRIKGNPTSHQTRFFNFKLPKDKSAIKKELENAQKQVIEKKVSSIEEYAELYEKTTEQIKKNYRQIEAHEKTIAEINTKISTKEYRIKNSLEPKKKDILERDLEELKNAKKEIEKEIEKLKKETNIENILEKCKIQEKLTTILNSAIKDFVSTVDPAKKENSCTGWKDFNEEDKKTTALDEAKQNALKQYLLASKNYAKFLKENDILPELLVLSGPPGLGKTAAMRYYKKTHKKQGIFFQFSAKDVQDPGIFALIRNRLELESRENPEKHVILFLDEVDSIAKNRFFANQKQQELSAGLLAGLLSVFEKGNEKIHIIVATNCFSMLDTALQDRTFLFGPKQDAPTIEFEQERKIYAKSLNDALEKKLKAIKTDLSKENKDKAKQYIQTFSYLANVSWRREHNLEEAINKAISEENIINTMEENLNYLLKSEVEKEDAENQLSEKIIANSLEQKSQQINDLETKIKDIKKEMQNKLKKAEKE